MVFDDQKVDVWVWLPQRTEPILMGHLAPSTDGKTLCFRYALSYLEHPDAYSVSPSEIPLRSGWQEPKVGLYMAGCFSDAAPDAWGRKVIHARQMALSHNASPLSEQDYLLLSSSDRSGALDFQVAGSTYITRSEPPASLECLLDAASVVELGAKLSEEQRAAVFHGTSLGGARPKALTYQDHSAYIVKFPCGTDTYNYIKAEYLAMKMAAAMDLRVADVKLLQAGSRLVLASQRFDRIWSSGWQRKPMISALTLLELDEMLARHASYEDLTHIIRKRFHSPKKDLKELFSRLIFHILCGNTDDHARNHSVFVKKNGLQWTPAYDICPQRRVGGIATHGMKILGQSSQSQLRLLLKAAPLYLLSEEQACEEIIRQLEIFAGKWHWLCAEAQLNEQEKSLLSNHIFLNSYAVEGLDSNHKITKIYQYVQKKIKNI